MLVEVSVHRFQSCILGHVVGIGARFSLRDIHFQAFEHSVQNSGIFPSLSLSRQQDVHLFLACISCLCAVGGVLGQAGHRETDEAEALVAAFQRLAGDFHLRIDMLYAEPCAPFVGAVEAALLKEVDDPAVTLGLALTLFSNMSPICAMIVFCSFEG